MYNHHIDSFMKAIECGSLTKAAQKLHVTPASVGNHIDDLEKLIGVKLIEREARGVKLTPAGQVFYRESPRLILAAEDIVAKTKKAASTEMDPIRIGNSPLTRLDDFQKIYLSSKNLRKYKIVLIQYNTNINVSRTVGVGQMPEIGFGIEEAFDNYPEVEFVSFDKLELTCIVPITHRLTAKKSLTYADLEGETLFFPSRGNPKLTRRFKEFVEKKYPKIKLETAQVFYDLEVINKCAQANRILLGFNIWDNIHPGMVNLPVDWEWSTPYGIHWKKSARQEVLDFAKDFQKAVKEYSA